MKYVVDANQAGQAVYQFMRRWNNALSTHIEGEVLDFGLNKAADDLCKRIADDPELDIAREPSPVRALLAARITIFLSNTITDPDVELMKLTERPTEREILSLVMRRLLTKIRLPADWNKIPVTASLARH